MFVGYSLDNKIKPEINKGKTGKLKQQTRSGHLKIKKYFP